MVTLTTTFWVFWGTAEMYYEGWGNPFPLPLAYLIPGTACLLFTLLALTWPRVGGWLLIVIGIGFTIWWWILAAGRGWLNIKWVLITFPFSGMLVLTGILFLLDARNRRRFRAQGEQPDPRWWVRHLRYLVGIGVPVAIFLGVSGYYFPTLIRRVDDGNRGARLIEGNGVTLIWAPEGPGWNWKQPWGGYPSWNSLAFYGVEPVGLKKQSEIGEGVFASEDAMRETGLCVYLNEDGTQLMDTPQYIWRMPTVEEIARSMTLHNQNANCIPKKDSADPERYLTGWMDCALKPDKETPLWAPDREPIYYWAADEYDEQTAYYLSYNGSLHAQNKDWGNPRHGYRCVKEP
jgi:hypothetical protein